MKVANSVYYHIAGTNNAIDFFRQSNSIQFSNNQHFNNTYKDLIDFSSFDKDANKGLIENFSYVLENIKNKNGYSINQYQDFIKIAIENFYHLNRRYWKIIFEEYRKNNFPELPSRMHCIYLCERENVEIWYEKVKRPQCEIPIIFELELNGNIHICDANWLEIDYVSYNNYIEIADKYWNGKFKFLNDFKMKEILFCGEIKVVKEFNSISNFKGNH